VCSQITTVGEMQAIPGITGMLYRNDRLVASTYTHGSENDGKVVRVVIENSFARQLH